MHDARKILVSSAKKSIPHDKETSNTSNEPTFPRQLSCYTGLDNGGNVLYESII
jgi:hypothetical protein